MGFFWVFDAINTLRNSLWDSQPRNPDNFPSIMADASAVDYENFGDGEVDVQAEYQDGQQGFEEQEGYQAYPQMDYGNYMPNGQLANGHMHNGQMPMYPPQGIRSDGQARQNGGFLKQLQGISKGNNFQHKPSLYP